MEIPSAAAAKQQAETKLGQKAQALIERCAHSILKAVERNEFDMTFGLSSVSSAESKILQDELRRKGYSVTYRGDQRDGDYLKISWKNYNTGTRAYDYYNK